MAADISLSRADARSHRIPPATRRNKVKSLSGRTCRREHNGHSTLTAVHEYLLPVDPLPRLVRVEPLRELDGVPHLGVDELGASLGGSEAPDRALVGVPDVDDDGVRVLHGAVVLVGLEVGPPELLEGGRLLCFVVV